MRTAQAHRQPAAVPVRRDRPQEGREARPGHRRDLARHRRSRPAHAGAHRRGDGRRRSPTPQNHQYPSYFGAQRYREACADVDAAPLRRRRSTRTTRSLALIGSKEGIAHLFLAFVDPGDVTLVPGCGYPVYHTGGILAGGETYWMPMTEENGFLADFESTPGRRARPRQDDVPELPEQPDLRDRERRVLRPRHRVRARPTTS